MIFIACADIHITNKCPVNRQDDYLSTCLGKFRQILSITNDTKYKTLLIGGDFFDSAHVPYEVTKQVIDVINEYPGVYILLVPGQHDQKYHSQDLKNTPLGVMLAAGIVSLLPSKTKPLKINGVTFAGAGWEEKSMYLADVILTHQFVVSSKEHWQEDKEEIITSSQMLKKYPAAKIIISGDNHTPFVNKTKNQLHVNCGSMMRKNKDQIGYKPACWKINTKKLTAKRIHLDIAKDHVVFDFEKIELENTKKDIKDEAQAKIEEDVKNFIRTLPTQEQDKPEFKKVLKRIVKKDKPIKAVKNKITEIMEKVS